MSLSNQLELVSSSNGNSSNTFSTKKKMPKIHRNDKNEYSKINTDDNNVDNDQDMMKIEKERVITGGYDDFSYTIPIKIEKSKSFCYKKIGNTYTFLSDRNGNPLFIIGPHWPMFFCFSSVMSGGLFLFFFCFWQYLHIIFKIAGVLNYSTYIISYTYTSLINPGYPKNDLDSRTGEPRSKFRFCDNCKMWVNVEKKTNHCFECNICVEGYDHHCPWTGKCIGRRNISSFYVFIISTLFLFAYIVCALTNAQTNRGKKNVNSG